MPESQGSPSPQYVVFCAGQYLLLHLDSKDKAVNKPKFGVAPKGVTPSGNKRTKTWVFLLLSLCILLINRDRSYSDEESEAEYVGWHLTYSLC